MIDSLDVKIGQMIMVGFRGATVQSDSPIIKAIQTNHLGGVWLVDNDSPMGETIGNIKSPEQVKKLVQNLQDAAQLPLFVTMDAEGGRVIRLKEKYGFPPTYSAQYLGAKNDLAFTYRQSEQIARTLKELGININFSPVVDVNRNSSNPALGKKERCFSDDPDIVTRHAQQVIEAHHAVGVKCCLKHFPGHGSARDDSHIGFVEVSETWREDELMPYQHLIKHKLADMILTAHIFIRHFDDKFPATLSKNIVTGLLRKRQAYNGIVITDDLGMGAIHFNYAYEQAIELAIQAGVDIVLHSNVGHYQENIAEKTFHIIRNLVKQKRVSEERIEESLQRIMKLKNELS